VAKTSEVLKRLIIKMDAGGLSQRDIEYGLGLGIKQLPDLERVR
jgi:hypothetical protein